MLLRAQGRRGIDGRRAAGRKVAGQQRCQEEAQGHRRIRGEICSRWYKPGLLLIGDAAHVMSPIAGVGINYAIQDAVVAANVLAGPLKAGRVTIAHLAEVQHQRQWPTKVIQAMQSFLQRNLVANVLESQQPVRPPGSSACFSIFPFCATCRRGWLLSARVACV